MKIKTIHNRIQANRLYNDNTLTIEGCMLIDENYQFIQSWINMMRANTEPITYLYNIKGKTMNRIFRLKGDARYPSGLNIVSIDNKFIDKRKIGSMRFDIGARWFKDIVDHNKSLQ